MQVGSSTGSRASFSLFVRHWCAARALIAATDACFELLRGWPHRFEAHTPLGKRRLGYFGLPLLWRDRAVGWANLAVKRGELDPTFGFVEGREPAEAGGSHGSMS